MTEMNDLNCDKCGDSMDILHCEEKFRNQYRQVLESTTLWCNHCHIMKEPKKTIKIKCNLIS